MPRPAPRRAALPLALLVLGLGLAACSGDDAPSVARPAPPTTFTAGEVPVLVPGRPGEEAEVLAPGETGTRQNRLAYEDAEVAFVTGMVPHHAQALEMAALAPERAADPRVKALAARIAADQAPEIATMQAWLEQNGLPAADEDARHGGHGGHGGGMKGMATEGDLARLVAAEGTAFDRLFLELMTEHHEGALAMVEEVGSPVNAVVAEIAADTQAKQSVEIARMQQLLASLPA